MRQKIMIILLMTWLGVGCKPESQLPVSVIKNVAIVRSGGNEQNEGCGYLLRIDNTLYKPSSLSEDFHVQGLEVDVEYTLTDRTTACYDWGPDPLPNSTSSKTLLPIIIIRSISKK